MQNASDPHALMRSRLESLIEAGDETARSLSLKVGRNPNLVGEILRNTTRSPTLETVEKLAGALDVPVSYLTGESVDRRRGANELAEPSVTEWHAPESRKRQWFQILAPKARHPVGYIAHDHPGLVATGKSALVVIDIGVSPREGELVVANVTDELGTGKRPYVGRLVGDSVIGVRFWLDPFDFMRLGQTVAVHGPAVALATSPDG